MNKVVIIGNLTKKPELLMTTAQTTFCRFSLATNRSYTDSDGNKITDFINISAWGKLALLACEYLNKGSKACVVGRLETRNYENKDGVRIYSFEVVADEIEFLTPKTHTDNVSSANVSPHSNTELSEKPKISSELKEVEVDILPF